MHHPTPRLKTRLITTLISVPLTLSLCACVGLISLSAPPQEQPYEIPPDDYRNINCQQYTYMQYHVARQVQTNQTAEKIYNAITPPNSSIRVQYLHAATIATFIEQNVPAIPTNQLAQLQRNCEQQNTLSALKHIINTSYCDVLQNIAHNSITNRDTNTSFAQADINTAITNFNHIASQTHLPELPQKIARQHITNVIQSIYNAPEKTTQQVDAEINDSCRIAQ